MKPTKGLFKDAHPSNQPEGTYSDLKNGVITNPVGSISNDKGNTLSSPLNLSDELEDFFIAGYKELHNNKVVIFCYDSSYSYIKLFSPYEQNKIENIYKGNLNFDVLHPVRADFYIESNGDTVIYFTDGKNPPRYININIDNTNKSELDFNLFQEFSSLPKLEILGVNNFGGVLQTGGYYLGVSFTTEDEVESNVLLFPNVVTISHIGDGQVVSGNILPVTGRIAGGTGKETTNNSIKYKISNIDSKFKYYNLYLMRTENSVIEQVKILSNLAISTYTEFTGVITGSESFADSTVEKVFINKAYYNSAKECLIQDNKLFLANLKGREYLKDNFGNSVQNYINNAKIEVIDKNIEQRGDNTNASRHDIIINKSFMRDEVYALYISFILKDGSETTAYHIPGRDVDPQETYVNIIPSFKSAQSGQVAQWQLPMQNDIMENATIRIVAGDNTEEYNNVIFDISQGNPNQGVQLSFQGRNASSNQAAKARWILDLTSDQSKQLIIETEEETSAYNNVQFVLERNDDVQPYNANDKGTTKVFIEAGYRTGEFGQIARWDLQVTDSNLYSGNGVISIFSLLKDEAYNNSTNYSFNLQAGGSLSVTGSGNYTITYLAGTHTIEDIVDEINLVLSASFTASFTEERFDPDNPVTPDTSGAFTRVQNAVAEPTTSYTHSVVVDSQLISWEIPRNISITANSHAELIEQALKDVFETNSNYEIIRNNSTVSLIKNYQEVGQELNIGTITHPEGSSNQRFTVGNVIVAPLNGGVNISIFNDTYTISYIANYTTALEIAYAIDNSIGPILQGTWINSDGFVTNEGTFNISDLGYPPPNLVTFSIDIDGTTVVWQLNSGQTYNGSEHKDIALTQFQTLPNTYTVDVVDSSTISVSKNGNIVIANETDPGNLFTAIPYGSSNTEDVAISNSSIVYGIDSTVQMIVDALNNYFNDTQNNFEGFSAEILNGSGSMLPTNSGNFGVTVPGQSITGTYDLEITIDSISVQWSLNKQNSYTALQHSNIIIEALQETLNSDIYTISGTLPIKVSKAYTEIADALEVVEVADTQNLVALSSVFVPSSTSEKELYSNTDYSNKFDVLSIDSQAKVFHFAPINHSVYHTSYWENKNEFYPTTPEWDIKSFDEEGNPITIGTLKGRNVRHHKMPGQIHYPTTVFQNPILFHRILGIKITNLVLPDEIVDQVLGYKIYYADRTTANATILTQAAAIPAFKNKGSENPEPSFNACNDIYAILENHLENASNFPGLTYTDIDQTLLELFDFSLLRTKKSIAASNYIEFIAKHEAQLNPVNASVIGGGNLNRAAFSSYSFYKQNLQNKAYSIKKIKAKAYIPNNAEKVELTNIGFSADYYNKWGPSHILTELTDDVAGSRKIAREAADTNPPTQQELRNLFSSELVVGYEDVIPIVNLKAYKPDVYLSFDKQELVFSGYVDYKIDNFRLNANVSGRTANTSEDIYGGDVFVARHGFRTTSRSWKKDTGNGNNRARLYHIVLETKDFPSYRYEGTQANEVFYPKTFTDSSSFIRSLDYDTSIITGMTQEQINADPRGSAFDNWYGYIEDYSGQYKAKVALPTPKAVYEYPLFANRVIRSQDELRVFLENDFKDFEQSKGEIVRLETLSGNIIIHCKRGMFITRGREQVVVNDFRTYLGQGDIFQNEPQLLFPTNGGYAGLLHPYSAIRTKYGYMFVDILDKKIFIYNEGVKEISSLGLREFFINKLDINSSLKGYNYYPHPILGFDPINNRLFVKHNKYNPLLPTRITDNGNKIEVQVNTGTQQSPILQWQETSLSNTAHFKNDLIHLSYHPELDIWVSFHTYDPEIIFNTHSHFFTVKENNVWIHNNVPTNKYYDEYHPFELEVIFNRDAVENLLLVNLVFVAELYYIMEDGTEDKIFYDEVPFTSIQINNSYQDSGSIVLKGFPEDDYNIRQKFNKWFMSQFRDKDVEGARFKDLYVKIKLIRDKDTDSPVTVLLHNIEINSR